MPKTLRRYLVYAVTVIAGVSAISHGPRAAQPETTVSLRFAAVGDSGTGEKAQYEVAAVMAATHNRLPFELVVMLGDNVYGGWSRTAVVERFERPYKPLLDAGVRFYASLGNHDEANERSYAPFHMDGQRYYTFTRSNVDFFALDSNYMDRSQLLWLEQHLQASRARWKLAFFHHPLYSSAERHGSEKDLRRLLEPLLIQYGVQVVLSGHDHVYERINPQHGITYFVCGSSGQLRRSNLERGSALTAAGFDQDRTFMVMETAADTLSFQAISRTGTVVDSGRVNWTARTSRSKGADLNRHEAGLAP
jgi:3',5'-cyclic AMP phosphodiesterase CpdA